ncbi:2-phospho-L-lactate guanylyltransferase [Frankia sp. CcI49]|uniref:2-phospho-L-lactate guanylyltransferase n=1 Tax=unclassified Frankia TaxID=2632575 RepID=UPI0006C9FF22|nr:MULTISPECIES: 2-phospho-L-lactate guanylyltransferase [unclassified Frankia]ONH50853.1 2-phospho-L-lactate guanylyltransferase [Frankia sp. CcI49]
MQSAETMPPWVVLVPLKPLQAAKSRLDHPDRGALALAMALDTTAAILDVDAEVVGSVIVVTDDPSAREALADLAKAYPTATSTSTSAAVAVDVDLHRPGRPDGSVGRVGRLLVAADEPRSGLNPAFAHAAALARRLHPGWGTAALSADLPALRPQELRRALTVAPSTGHAVLADAVGTGTVLLSAAPGTELRPRFGSGSFRAHRDAGATDLTGLLRDQVPGLRRDVDTVSDLADARALGLGPATRRVLKADPSPRSAA